MVKEKIVSITIINPNTTQCVTESGIEFEQWHMENDHPQVGEIIDTDDFVDKFTEATYDLRTKRHRSPFY